MPEILVLYYSRGGSVARLARQVARGIGEIEGMAARLRTVPPVAPVTDVAAPPVPEEGSPYVTRADLAECAGLLYLCSTLDSSPMVGSIAAEAAMTQRLTLRYPTMTAATDNLLTRAGEQVTGHEFHHTQVAPVAGAYAAWTVDGEDVGFASASLHASYLHTHWAGHPRLAQRFADAVHGRGHG